eukprot:SAG31_NODE_19_length_35031_cov_42.510707_8_plen_157_part_00
MPGIQVSVWPRSHTRASTYSVGAALPLQSWTHERCCRIGQIWPQNIEPIPGPQRIVNPTKSSSRPVGKGHGSLWPRNPNRKRTGVVALTHVLSKKSSNPVPNTRPGSGSVTRRWIFQHPSIQLFLPLILLPCISPLLTHAQGFIIPFHNYVGRTEC